MLDDDIYNKAKEVYPEMLKGKDHLKLAKGVINVPLDYIMKEMKDSQFNDFRCRNAVKRACNSWDLAVTRLKKEKLSAFDEGGFKSYLKKAMEPLYKIVFGEE